MDPWADSAAGWSPNEEKVRPSSRRASSSGTGDGYKAGPLDPWAEPTSSTSIPTTVSHHGQPEPVERARSDSGGDFDPWGGNSAPIAPLSNPYHRGDSQSRINTTSPELGWAESDRGDESISHQAASSAERDSFPNRDKGREASIVVDDDDPWGSGAAARRIKAQEEEEMLRQRMEILQLQEEARGKQPEEEGKEDEEGGAESEAKSASQDRAEGEASAPAPATSGWRSIFSRGASKPEDGITGSREAAKEEAVGASKGADAKGSPTPSPAVAAPRLWQAPSLLGGHNRSSSSASRSSATKEQPQATTTPMTQGPGWEVTTKKQQGGGGGLIQSLFGAGTRTSGDGEKAIVSEGRRDEKTTAMNPFGRGLQRPPVVSAADEEEESFDAEETGIEWESGAAFDEGSKGVKKQADLLSDDVESKPSDSTMGKLFGKWLERNPQAGKKPESMTKEDLAWLEGVGARQDKEGGRGTNEDEDWMAFISQQPEQERGILKQGPGLPRSMGDRFKVSSTAKGTVSAKVPPLAPPPAPSSSSGSSPFAFRGPGQGASKASRLTSGASSKTAGSSDAFGDFEHASPSMDSSPNPSDIYRDEDNHSSLLKGTGGRTQTGGLLRNLQSRPSRIRYDYDEEDVDAQDDSWTAFHDEPQTSSNHSEPYRDRRRSPPRVASPATQPRREDKGPSRTSTPNSAKLPPPQSGSSGRPTSWDRNAPLLPPPGAHHASAGMTSQAAPAMVKAKSLSEGKTLTNDDLSFFENL